MRSVTTFSTQDRAGELRRAWPRRRARLRRDPLARSAQRRERLARPRCGVRPAACGERRNDAPRLRPEPMLRGFLPLCRH
jgi:hypothetical protein